MKKSTLPFFIIGCARSGTTLMRRILNSHSELAVPLESLFIIDYLKPAKKINFQNLLSMLLNEPEVMEWGITPKISDFLQCKTMPDAIETLHQLYLRKNNKKYWGQKTPRFIRNLDLLKENFPPARFIHVVRDPRAAVNSMIRSDVHRSTAYHGALRWNNDVSHGILFEKKHPEAILRITYESLVNNPKDTMLKVCGFLDVDFEPDILTNSGGNISNEYSQFYSNLHINLSQNTTAEFSSKWTHQLSETEVKIIESICSPLMHELGYKPLFNAKLKQSRYIKNRIQRIPRIIMQAYRYLRYRSKYFFYLIWRKQQLGLLGDFIWNINQ